MLGLRGLPDALPGRMETIELWPLSQGEIDGQPDGFVDAVFDRVAMVDSGVAANLLGQDADSLRRLDGPLGPLLEGFVAMEIARQLTWSRQRVELFHYRTLPFGPRFRAVPVSALWEL